MSLVKTWVVAKTLNCTPRNVRYLVKKGVLKPIYIDNRYYLFDSNEILEYLKNKKGGVL